jgi:NADP-dependent 3-hydroxy acid dehydrogenase YdfG
VVFIGGAVARAFAREGAWLFLAYRTQAKLDALADDVRARDGLANVAAIDALDERAVDAFVDATGAGRVQRCLVQCHRVRRRAEAAE